VAIDHLVQLERATQRHEHLVVVAVTPLP